MQIQKKLIFGVLLTAILPILADGPSACGTDLTTLTVGTDIAGILGYQPFEQQSVGTLSGYDIAIAIEIARRLGYQSITFRQIPYSQNSKNRYPLLSELDRSTSQIDLAIAALSIIERPSSPFNNTGFVTYSDDSFGAIISAQADQKFNDPNTFLELMNEKDSTQFSILASREDITIDVNFFFPDKNNPYINITAGGFEDLTNAVNTFKEALKTPTNADITFLLVDNDNAKSLVNNPSVFTPGSVRFISNVIDQFDVSPSQGLGIAVGGISTGSEGCQQLYANVAQAVRDMLKDGTFARLREQFNITSSDTNIGATSVPTTVAPNINSNAVYNFYLSKYGSFNVIIGQPVPVV